MTARSQFREQRTSFAEDHKDSGSTGKRGETAEMQQVFDIDISAPYYTRAISIYQQTTTEKKADHTAVLETAIHLWRSAMKWGELLAHTDYGWHG